GAGVADQDDSRPGDEQGQDQTDQRRRAGRQAQRLSHPPRCLGNDLLDFRAVMPPQEPSAAATSPLVRALLDDLGIPAGGVELAVDPGDEMLAFLVAQHAGDRERALYSYFQSGASIAGALAQVLRWRFGEPGRIVRLLDFASGYGRVTRFLLRLLPA